MSLWLLCGFGEKVTGMAFLKVQAPGLSRQKDNSGMDRAWSARISEVLRHKGPHCGRILRNQPIMGWP